MKSQPKGVVFISHSHHDHELVRDLMRRIRNVGLEPKTDLDMMSGSNWTKIVRENIRDADAILVLITPAALASDWTMTELGMADGFDRIILAVTAGLQTRELPEPLRYYNVVPFDQVDESLHKLADQLTMAANR